MKFNPKKFLTQPVERISFRVVFLISTLVVVVIFSSGFIFLKDKLTSSESRLAMAGNLNRANLNIETSFYKLNSQRFPIIIYYRNNVSLSEATGALNIIEQVFERIMPADQRQSSTPFKIVLDDPTFPMLPSSAKGYFFETTKLIVLKWPLDIFSAVAAHELAHAIENRYTSRMWSSPFEEIIPIMVQNFFSSNLIFEGESVILHIAQNGNRENIINVLDNLHNSSFIQNNNVMFNYAVMQAFSAFLLSVSRNSAASPFDLLKNYNSIAANDYEAFTNAINLVLGTSFSNWNDLKNAFLNWLMLEEVQQEIDAAKTMAQEIINDVLNNNQIIDELLNRGYFDEDIAELLKKNDVAQNILETINSGSGAQLLETIALLEESIRQLSNKNIPLECSGNLIGPLMNYIDNKTQGILMRNY